MVRQSKRQLWADRLAPRNRSERSAFPLVISGKRKFRATCPLCIDESGRPVKVSGAGSIEEVAVKSRDANYTKHLQSLEEIEPSAISPKSAELRVTFGEALVNWLKRKKWHTNLPVSKDVIAKEKTHVDLHIFSNLWSRPIRLGARDEIRRLLLSELRNLRKARKVSDHVYPQKTKHAIFTIRYSVLNLEGKNSWKMGKESELEEYEKKLFDPQRLEARRKTFSKITIPSIVAAVKQAPGIKSEVHILTSENLPELDKNFLLDIAAKQAFVKVYFLPPNAPDMCVGDKEYAENLNKGDTVASIRLDDDDAVSKNYLFKLSEWMNLKKKEFVVSMPLGYGVVLNEGAEPVKARKLNKKLIAAGLAYVYQARKNSYENIYKLGNHTKIDRKIFCITDDSDYFYIRTYHPYNDSGDSFKIVADNDPALCNLDQIFDSFGSDAGSSKT